MGIKGLAAAAGAAVLLACAPGAALAKNDQATSVQLLAINDFHGNLQPPTGSSGRIQVGPTTNVDAGGSAYMATWLNRLRQDNPNTITVGGGDLIGASPLLSGLFHDEPTIEAMNAMHLDVTSVGNHEFDEGKDELLRMQNGGCHPIDGCQDGDPFSGAAFQYLSANVFLAGTNRTLLPPYEIRKVGKTNIKVAFIGLTLKGTPLIVTPSGVAGLEFRDEVETVNSLVQRLRTTEGVRTFVVLIHQGGQQNAPFANGFMDINRCDNFTGDIKPIVEALSPQVDVVVSAHTHQPYVCRFNGILTTSASSFGRLITGINLTIDNSSKDVVADSAVNHIVTRDVPADLAQTQIINKYRALSDGIANQVVGSITGDITRSAPASGESSLGDVIADAQLASTAPSDFGGAVVAFMNPGGIRADLTYAASAGGEAPGEVTYSELFNVQPFNNVMTVKTMTGDMIYRLLAQQFNQPSPGALRILQVSKGFTYSYRYDPATQAGEIVDGSVKINGVPIDKAASYRVAMNNFLADGGDGFTVFREGTDPLGGAIDLDALVAYFKAAGGPIAPGPQDRITRLP
jgi:5'-nucleotidase